jgi:cytochrome P450
MADAPAPAPVDLSRFNPFDPKIQQCPFPHYRAMQDQGGVFPVAGTDLFMITKHELVTPILRNTTLFSNNFGSAGEPAKGDVVDRIKAVLATGWPQVPTMLTVDPPAHTRFRGTVATYFTPRKMAELREPVTEIVHRLVDTFIDHSEINFVTAFGIPVPIEAIAQILNVPADRMDDFKRWSDDSIANIGTAITDDQRVAAYGGIVEFQHYFAEQLESRRANPQGDLLSDLITAEIDDDNGGKRPLTMAETLSIIQQLLVAGNETTTKALTEGMMLLAQHPEQWEKLRADPVGRAAAVTEEVLRLSTPTQGMFRLVMDDTEIEGVPIPKGSRLVLVYSAANRDPKVWGDESDSFDPDRTNHKDHLAFGKGIHFCLGAPLSRLEMQIAFEVLAKRLKSIKLADSNTFEYHPSFMLRGLKRLDLHIEAA